MSKKEKTSGDNKKRGGKAALFVSVAALGLVAVNYYGDIKREHRLHTSELTLEIVRSAFISPDTIQTSEKSVYLALMNAEPFATAFVVDRERGLLATNSHVAAAFGKMGKMSVVGVDGKEMAIIGARLHKGYELFPRHVGGYEPVKTSPGNAGGRAVDIPGLFGMVGGYDVALLQVSMDDAKNLAPDLPLASREDLLALRSGDVIASVGYPLDLSSTAAIEKHALTPKATVGRISAMSSFIGVRTGTASNDAISQLIIHPLHTQPGTSGSPMINDKGHVIAVNSGASARATSSGSTIEAGDRHGQRADMLLDLLDDTDKQAIADLYTPIWNEQLAQFARMPDVFAEVVTAMMTPKRDLAKAVTSVRDLEFAAGQDDLVYRTSSNAHMLKTQITLDPTRAHLLFATDYRTGIGSCNPAFRMTKSDGTTLVADRLGTSEFTIYQLQIPAQNVGAGADTAVMAAEFSEPRGCNSMGQTMHLHHYSWAADDIALAMTDIGLLAKIQNGIKAGAQALWSALTE